MNEPFSLEPTPRPWQSAMEDAVKLFLEQTALANNVISEDHVRLTPKRVTKALEEASRGCALDPASFLTTTFSSSAYDEMVKVGNIRVVSLCAHHFKEILGRAYFAYIPDRQIVGLSKIPRFIDVLCKRPQVQEQLTEQIVNVFQEVVAPAGCAVTIRAYHLCMLARGVQEPAAITETTALRGVFINSDTRSEFLGYSNQQRLVFP